MCSQCRQKGLEINPEYEAIFHGEYEDEFYPQMEYDREVADAPLNSKDNIKWVQQSLNKIVGLRLDVDGVAGSMTKGAIKTYQGNRGLPATGNTDEQTMSALKKDMGGLSSPGSSNLQTVLFQGPKRILNTKTIHVIRARGKVNVTNDGETEVAFDQCTATIILDKFVSGEYLLRYHHYELLMDVMNAVKAAAGLDLALVIEGHADVTGTEARNAALSLNRAFEVERFLEKFFSGNSIPVTVVEIGAGASRPISATDNSRNRRVEIKFCKIVKLPPPPVIV